MNQAVHEIFQKLSEEEKLELIQDLIGSAFVWEYSQEGRSAWENVHDFLNKARRPRKEARQKKEEEERLAKLTLEEAAAKALRAIKERRYGSKEIADLEAVLKRAKAK